MGPSFRRGGWEGTRTRLSDGWDVEARLKSPMKRQVRHDGEMSGLGTHWDASLATDKVACRVPMCMMDGDDKWMIERREHVALMMVRRDRWQGRAGAECKAQRFVYQKRLW